MPHFILIAFTLLAMTLAPQAWTATFAGSVKKIPTGDRLVVSDKKGRVFAVRLHGVMAPVETQASFNASRKMLRRLIAKKRVWVDWFEKKEGAELGKVFIGGEDLALKLLQRGAVWYDYRQARDQSISDRGLYKEAEEDAHRKHLGLWRNTRAVEPWLWNKATRSAATKK